MLIARTRIRLRGVTVTVVVESEDRTPRRPPLRVVTTTGEPAPESAAVITLRKAPTTPIVPLRRVG